MADFSQWSRENLEAVANDMLAALLQAQQWVEHDEEVHGRTYGVGNSIRNVLVNCKDSEAR